MSFYFMKSFFKTGRLNSHIRKIMIILQKHTVRSFLLCPLFLSVLTACDSTTNDLNASASEPQIDNQKKELTETLLAATNKAEDNLNP